MADNFVSWPAVVNDDGSLSTGTPFSAEYDAAFKASIADNVYDSTNPTVKTKTIIAEVVAARGTALTVDARLDTVLNEDGTLKVKWVEHENTDTTAGSSVGAGETTLSSRIIPASTLSVNQQNYRFECYGATANNATAKTLRVYLGATLLATFNLTINSAALWRVEGVITRLGASSELVRITFTHASATVNISIQAATPGENLATGLLLKVTGQGGANGDITSAVLHGYTEH